MNGSRFLIHPIIDRLAQKIVKIHALPDREKVMLFPSRRCATRCHDFLISQTSDVDTSSIRVLDFGPQQEQLASSGSQRVQPRLSAIIYPNVLWPTAKIFWQHTGEGISSRRAEYCQKALDDQTMVEAHAADVSQVRMTKGPRRYQRGASIDHGSSNGNSSNRHSSSETGSSTKAETVQDSAQFVEERFGRNLNVDLAAQAKLAIRKRIAGCLTSSQDLPESLDKSPDTDEEGLRDVEGFCPDDVYLFSCGMNAIFTSHRVLRLACGEMKSIMYGFPYVDTLKILEKWGPGAKFYGYSSAEELDDLEHRLRSGERFLALYCEFPGNPLLMSPNLKRIRQMADTYDFAVVVDETIGNFLNTKVLPYADVIVSSLTKIFSGDSNVMGGAMILNPRGRYYSRLREVLQQEYEDNQFEEDSVYLERNSRDFVNRIQRVNWNAEAVADLLRAHPGVKQVNYPKYSPTRKYYDDCRVPNGGYGGLLSATFHSMGDAEAFYDHLDTQKGPSLGTNFTLSSPFVILAHFNELDWAAQYGCEASLIRFSVGLEETTGLVAAFQQALDAIDHKHSNGVANSK